MIFLGFKRFEIFKKRMFKYALYRRQLKLFQIQNCRRYLTACIADSTATARVHSRLQKYNRKIAARF